MQVPSVPSDAWMHGVCTQYLPQVLQGGVADWPALTKWAGASGLDTLRSIAGDANVQVMASPSTNFSGQLRDHGMQWLPLSTFLDACAAVLSAPPSTDAPSTDRCLYLAQCTMLHQATATTWQQPLEGLAALAQHIALPAWLAPHVPCVDQVNLWMTTKASASSVHYDNFHNALCLVQGCKRVRLLAPSSAAAAQLPPVGLHTENPNHSQHMGTGAQAVWTESAWQRLVQTPGLHAMEATLHAGDVLLIPEGWWHQVSSSAVSIAVNMWWHSAAHAALSHPHMDAYFLRRCATTSLALTRERLLPPLPPGDADAAAALRTLTAAAAAAVAPGSAPPPDVAATLAALTPAQCATVLLRMAHRARPALRALLLYGLDPLAAEVLTQQWDALDQRRGQGARDGVPAAAFFDELFGALGEEASEVSSRLLALKEEFGWQCLHVMLAEQFGVDVGRTGDDNQHGQ